MTALQSQHCCQPSADATAMPADEAAIFLKQLDPPWQADANGRSISNSYTFRDYYQTIAFVNVIAQIAHQQDHHPQLSVSYNRCTVSYSTHHTGGLTINDFICAAKINAAQNL